jgi:hypothetical protein
MKRIILATLAATALEHGGDCRSVRRVGSNPELRPGAGGHRTTGNTMLQTTRSPSATSIVPGHCHGSLKFKNSIRFCRHGVACYRHCSTIRESGLRPPLAHRVAAPLLAFKSPIDSDALSVDIRWRWHL